MPHWLEIYIIHMCDTCAYPGRFLSLCTDHPQKYINVWNIDNKPQCLCGQMTEATVRVQTYLTTANEWNEMYTKRVGGEELNTGPNEWRNN